MPLAQLRLNGRPARWAPVVAALASVVAIFSAGVAGAAAVPPLAAPATQEEATGLRVVADDHATAAAAILAPVALMEPLGNGSQRTLYAPPGFSVSVLATGLLAPRFMTFDDAGALLVADQGAGSIYRYATAGGALAPGGARQTLLSGLSAPSNVALFGGYLYIGQTDAIVRYPYDAARGVSGGAEVVIPELPVGGHGTRTVVFGPDGFMYVSVGSSCNICDESDERRAAVLRFAPDGSGYARFASGLRNAVGLAIQPNTGMLWATNNERDDQGDEFPPDFVTTVREGENFGWPGCQPPQARPQYPGPDCSGITPPTVAIQAHSAPLGLAFYAGSMLPAEFRDDLLVVQHGSWNRQPPAAPKLIRIHFQDDIPIRAQDFLTGWQDSAGKRWGRPAGVVIAPDGSIIVSDDQAGAIYRVTYG